MEMHTRTIPSGKKSENKKYEWIIKKMTRKCINLECEGKNIHILRLFMKLLFIHILRLFMKLLFSSGEKKFIPIIRN
jgi:hypothetical protein